MTGADREYRETFSYKTEADRVQQARANVESVAERFGLRLADFDATTDGKGDAGVRVTVVGKSADLTRMRENVVGDVSIFEGFGGTSDLTDLVWDLTAGPALDFAATRARRGWWAAKRRRNRENDDDAGQLPDIGL